MSTVVRPPRTKTEIRVRYAETDQMGVVHHANYLVWMEIGRVELVRELGIDYHDLESAEGLFLSVINATCRYLYPARYDQHVAIETELVLANARMVGFEYVVRCLNTQRVLAEGATRHMWLNRQMRPARLPARYIAMLQPEGAQVEVTGAR